MILIKNLGRHTLHVGTFPSPKTSTNAACSATGAMGGHTCELCCRSCGWPHLRAPSLGCSIQTCRARSSRACDCRSLGAARPAMCTPGDTLSARIGAAAGHTCEVRPRGCLIVAQETPRAAPSSSAAGAATGHAGSELRPVTMRFRWDRRHRRERHWRGIRKSVTSGPHSW
jgi:hypothetical protein